MDILQFIFKFAFMMFLAGGLICCGIYVFVMGYSTYLRHTKYRTWVFVENSRLMAEGCELFNTKKVFRWIVGLAVLIEIFWLWVTGSYKTLNLLVLIVPLTIITKIINNGLKGGDSE